MDADEVEEKKMLIETAMKPVGKVMHGDTVPMLRIRMKSFFRKIQE